MTIYELFWFNLEHSLMLPPIFYASMFLSAFSLIYLYEKNLLVKLKILLPLGMVMFLGFFVFIFTIFSFIDYEKQVRVTINEKNIAVFNQYGFHCLLQKPRHNDVISFLSNNSSTTHMVFKQSEVVFLNLNIKDQAWHNLLGLEESCRKIDFQILAKKQEKAFFSDLKID